MRLILDTSVVIASARSRTGASRILIDAALAHDFEILLSVPLALEYEDVLTRSNQMEQSGFSFARIEELVTALIRVSIQIELGEYTGPFSSDADDNHVLNLAQAGEADAVVTHNVRHFERPLRALGVHLYTPGEALRLLRI